MARKSRRANESAGENVRSEIQTQTQMPLQSRTQMPAAAYVRLSLENSGNETDDSIQTQIQLLCDFIGGRDDLYLQDTYVDNGFTGTNFDRPEFERMMQDAYSGKIQCIVVKDLSRFGRNYLETGHYLETIFPRLNIRFIAVTDNFDNFRSGDLDSLSVPVKNMVNAMYAKDISRKIASLYEMKRQNGDLTAANPPYGYLVNKEKMCYVPDEETSPYVRAMFRWMIMGVKRDEIARRLDLLGAPTPLQRIKKNQNYDGKWNSTMLTRLLRNSSYAGDLVAGMSRKAIYKGIKYMAVPEEEWIVKKDAHEALVPRPDYDAVQEMLDKAGAEYRERIKKSREIRAATPNHFRGMLYCGCCRKEMSFARVRYEGEDVPHLVYECSAVRGECPGAQYSYHEKMIMIIVMDQIRNLIKAALDQKKLAEEILKPEGGSVSAVSVQKRTASLSYRISQAEEMKARTYEDYAEGLLTREEYQYLKEHYISEKQKLESQLQETEQEKEKLERRAKAVVDMADHFEKYADSIDFDESLMRELTDKIYIGPDNTVEIIFKCRDVFRDFMESVKAVKAASDMEAETDGK